MSNIGTVTVRAYGDHSDRLDTHWIPCIICQNCVEMFLHDMMPNYKKNLLEADCRASQLRVLAQGPPVYVKVSFLEVVDRGRTTQCSSLRKASMWRVFGFRALEKRGARR